MLKNRYSHAASLVLCALLLSSLSIAASPLVGYPLGQQAYLKASNTGAYDWFGYSVAVSGDTVVVGAYREDSNATRVDGDDGDDSATSAGAAYAFGTWKAYLPIITKSGSS